MEPTNSLEVLNQVLQGLNQAQLQHPSGLIHQHWPAIAIAIGWITHANWDKVLASYDWVREQGGVGGILAGVLWGGSKPVTTPAAPANPPTVSVKPPTP